MANNHNKGRGEEEMGVSGGARASTPEIGVRRPVTLEIRRDAEVQARQTFEVAQKIAGTRARLNRLERTVGHAESVATVMDSILADPAIGLFLSDVGDVAGAVPGIIIVAEAINAGVPAGIILKMLARLVIDAGLGMIPFAGALVDVFYKANKANARLLRKYLEKARKDAYEEASSAAIGKEPT